MLCRVRSRSFRQASSVPLLPVPPLCADPCHHRLEELSLLSADSCAHLLGTSLHLPPRLAAVVHASPPGPAAGPAAPHSSPVPRGTPAVVPAAGRAGAAAGALPSGRVRNGLPSLRHGCLRLPLWSMYTKGTFGFREVELQDVAHFRRRDSGKNGTVRRYTKARRFSSDRLTSPDATVHSLFSSLR